jgi:hypothetical protein
MNILTMVEEKARNEKRSDEKLNVDPSLPRQGKCNPTNGSKQLNSDTT